MTYKVKTLLLITLFVDILLSLRSLHAMIISGFEIAYLLLTFSGLFCFSLISLSSYSILYVYYGKIKNYYIVLIMIIIMIPLILFRYLIEEIIFDFLWGFTNYNKRFTLDMYIYDNIYYAIRFYAVGIIYYYYQFTKFIEKRQQRLALENQKIKLDFLRTQINPHFLFNVINTLYYLVRKKSEKSLSTIEKFSNLLRYSLYESPDFVDLKSELEYIDDYIELESLRNENGVNISKDYPDNIKNIKIARYCLIPFVENALKHGVIDSKVYPIKLILKFDEDRLYFTVRNKIANQNRHSDHGIGISNLRKRLELIYVSNFELNIKNSQEIYETSLKICYTK